MSWDEQKIDGVSSLTADEWNDHVSDQKSRAKVSTGDGAPVSTPEMTGAIYLDTTNEDFYIAKGTSGSSDWIQLTEYADFLNHIVDTTIHFTQSDISITASQVSDFDTAVSGNADVSANTSARHTHANQAHLDSIDQDLSTISTVSFGDVTVNNGVTAATVDFFVEQDNGNSGASASINWTLRQKQKLTLTDNATLTFTDPDGPCNLVLKLVQDATGGWTPTFPSNVKFDNTTVLDFSSDPGNSVRIVSLYFDGTDYYAQITDYFV